MNPIQYAEQSLAAAEKRLQEASGDMNVTQTRIDVMTADRDIRAAELALCRASATLEKANRRQRRNHEALIAELTEENRRLEAPTPAIP